MFFKSITTLFIIVGFICCKSDSKENKAAIEEIAFNIDSSYFDFKKIDTFQNVTMPHLKNWEVSTEFSNDNRKINVIMRKDSLMYLNISNFTDRSINSFRFYKEQHKLNKLNGELLDISAYLKDGKKVTQLMLRDNSDINFKLIEDLNGVSKEVDIFTNVDAYVEE
ncbi:MAG: hypothetical protein HKO66_06625, partial [Saprospiraceae bacterium]|nr:hypothetical protein [Saprospiraceae bacterium]